MSYYVWNDQKFSSMEELKAAMAGGSGGGGASAAAPAAAQPKQTIQQALGEKLSNPSLINKDVELLFIQYSGSDAKLQFSELQCLAASVAAKMGLDPSAFGDLQYLFKRYDFDRDGSLDLNESIGLIRTMLDHHHHELYSANTGGTVSGGGYSVGEEVQYRNGQPVKWMDCTVRDVKPDGSVQISLFDMYLPPALVKQKLRKSVCFTYGGQKGKKEKKEKKVKEKKEKKEKKGKKNDDDSDDSDEGQGYKITNQNFNFSSHSSIPVSPAAPAAAAVPGEIRVIVMFNTYNWPPVCRPHGGWGPLDTHHGGRIMQSLAQACGVRDISVIQDQQCEPQVVVNKIYEVGQRCSPNDTFVFYYTGHGDSLPDQDGDEIDGTDEALCTVIGGQCGQWTYLRDDDFSNALGTYVKATNVLCIMDCCHSGTITDLDKPCWAGKRAVQISGCRDSEESVATGQGGLMTRAFAQAAKSMIGQGPQSCAHAYNNTLRYAQPLFAQFPHPSGRPQNITMQTNFGVDAQRVSFPLTPGLMRDIGSSDILDKLQQEIDDFSKLE